MILYDQVSRSLGKSCDYDEGELSHEVPYLPYSTLEKYLPSPTVFVVVVVVLLLIALIVGVALLLYFIL